MGPSHQGESEPWQWPIHMHLKDAPLRTVRADLDVPEQVGALPLRPYFAQPVDEFADAFGLVVAVVQELINRRIIA